MNTNYTFKMRDGGSLNGEWLEIFIASNHSRTFSGVRAKLKIMIEEYVPWTDTSGILVFVHNIEDYIFSESVRYMAEPNGEFIIDIFNVRSYEMIGKKLATRFLDNPKTWKQFFFEKKKIFLLQLDLTNVYISAIYMFRDPQI